MKQTLTFHSSVIAPVINKPCAEAFDLSIEAFDNRDYARSLHALLDSIHPGIRKRFGDKEGSEFHIPHGPLMISLRVDQQNIQITAPLVTLPEENRIAVMRQVAAANFNDLDLARLVLRDDRLSFEYSSSLPHSHPRKIRSVLQEICRAGVKYDREFVNHFGAQRLTPPRFTPYDFGDVDYVYEVIRQSGQECLDAVRYFETSRQFGEMWQIINTTFLKLMYVIHPQGCLLSDLQKAIRDMQRDLPYAETVATGKADIRRLMEKTKEDIAEDLYYVETFLPAKRHSNLQRLRETHENAYRRIATYMEAGEYRKAGIRLLGEFYQMYYDNHMQEDLDRTLVKVLSQTSAQTWDKAAPALFRVMENLMQGRIRRNIPPVAA